MRSFLFALVAVCFVAFAPVVFAQPSVPPVPVYPGCVATPDHDCGGHDVCGPAMGRQAPFCTNYPVCPHLECAQSASSAGPQTYPACVAGVTAPSCFDGYDVCSPYASLQRPACVNVPGCPHYSCVAITESSQLVCIEGSACGEPSMLVCVNTHPKPCVPDPCATANCFNVAVVSQPRAPPVLA